MRMLKIDKTGVAVSAIMLALLLALSAIIFAERKTVAAVAVSEDNDVIEYLEDLGYAVKEGSVTMREIRIPQEFDAVYTAYNELQKKAGMDLYKYRGKTVAQYSCELDGYDEPVQAHVLVSKGKIIGGDVCSAAMNGFMYPLVQKR